MTEGWPLAIGVLVLVGLGISALPYRRVSRRRLERFAARHRLRVTAESGPMMLRYLGTTWAWRVAGSLIGGEIALYRAWLHDGAIQLDYLAVFAGWFAGAVVAEWRVERVASAGPRRSAALTPRRAGDYVTLWTVVLPVAIYLLVIGVEAFGLVNAPRHRADLLVSLMITAISAALILIVAQHILGRPQPVVVPSVVEADETRRAASLRVLAGSAIAIGGYLLVGLAGVSTEPVWLGETWQPMVPTLGAVLLPAVGALAAMLSRPYRARRVLVATAP